MEILAEEPCGRTVPRNRLTTLSLYEYLTGIADEDKISADSLVLEKVNFLEVQLARGTEVTNKAPQWPIILIIALELYVTSNTPQFLRFVAATELVKAYGTLRNDDLAGAVMKTLRFGDRFVSVRLRRTKVTGAGHKQIWVEVHILKEMTVAFSGWINELKHLCALPDLVWDRDYWLPVPSDDLKSVLR